MRVVCLFCIRVSRFLFCFSFPFFLALLVLCALWFADADDDSPNDSSFLRHGNAHKMKTRMPYLVTQTNQTTTAKNLKWTRAKEGKREGTRNEKREANNT